jgi:hypothetical protein
MMKLVLPFPPSVNTYWRAPNKGRWQDAISSVLLAGHIRALLALRLLNNYAACLNQPHHQRRLRSFSIHQMPAAAISTITTRRFLMH